MSLVAGLFETEPTVKLAWPGHPVLSSDTRALWFPSGGEAWFVAAPDEELFYFSPDFGGHCPPWYEWVDQELSDYLRVGHTGLEMALWLMSEGIAPGQPFKLGMTFASYGGGLWVDYDDELDFEVLCVEPWTDKQVAEAWSEWAAVWGLFE